MEGADYTGDLTVIFKKVCITTIVHISLGNRADIQYSS